MKNKTKIILSSILSIILCASLIAGATFALFTNKSEVNIAVTSGTVNVQASIGGLNTYSALVKPTADFSAYEQGEDDIIETGMQLGEFAADYYHDQQEAGKFSVGGTAGIEDNVLKLSKMVPGDKATATITLTNNSNVGIKYRLIIKCTSGLKLFSGLLFKVQGIGAENATTNVMSYASAWQTWELSAPKTKTLGVSVELPLDAGDEYQDLATNILFAIEAVQGNAATSGEAEIVYVPAVENAVVSKTAQQTVVAHTDTEIKTPNTPAGAAEKETTVTFQADTSTLPAGKTSELTVETYAVEVSSVKFEVTDEGKDAYAGLELILKVNGEQVTNFGGKDVTIVTYIEKGLTNVVVKYNGEGADPTGVVYESDTGKLSFQTNHFSEYYVIADTVAKIGDMPYISLASAIAAASENGTIDLVRNVTVGAEITKPLTINLGDCTITGTITIPANCRLFQSAEKIEVCPSAAVSNNNGTHTFTGYTLQDTEACDTDGEDGKCSKCGFGFVTVGKVVPEGCTYTCSSGTVYSAGETIPADYAPQDSDTFTDAEYIYKYNRVKNGMFWTSNNLVFDGWGVVVKDTSKSSYGLVKSEINGKPVNKFFKTYYNCTNLVTAPAIPDCAIYIDNIFEGCTSLETAPIIPANVNHAHSAFYGCTSLKGIIRIDGNIEIATNTYEYFLKGCAQDADHAIVLTGSSTSLGTLKSTAYNNGEFVTIK